MFIVVMGVSGCGKSTLASVLAESLGWNFLEGDDLHSQASLDRMQAGIALNDDDRWPWLERIVDWMRRESGQGRHAVVACSALKRSYRDRLRSGGDVRFVYLHVPRLELERRIMHRTHFMPPSLLDSQLNILEAPGADEGALTLPGYGATSEQVQEIRGWLSRRSARPMPPASS